MYAICQTAVLVLLLSISTWTRFAHAAGPSQCYFLNGDKADDHSPCSPAADRNETQHSSCCLMDGNSRDMCTSSGLCYEQHFKDNRAMYFQGGCTDPTGQDSSCRTVCQSNSDLAQAQYYAVVPCPNGQFCCSTVDKNNLGNADCCSSRASAVTVGTLLFQSVSGLIYVTKTQAVVQTAQVIAQGTGTTIQTETASCQSVSDASGGSDTRKTTVVGASVGVALGTVLVASLVCTAIMFRKLKQLQRQEMRSPELWAYQNQSPHAKVAHPHELENQERSYELEPNNTPHELSMSTPLDFNGSSR